MTELKRWVGGVAVCILVLLLLGAGPMDRAGDLARAIPDRSLMGAESQKLTQLRDAVAEFDPGQLAAAAQAHARQRASTLQKAAANAGEEFSVYRDLMRFPRANRGFAVAVSGRVIRVEGSSAEVAGSLVWLAPNEQSTGKVALLFPEDIDRPDPGAEIKAVGIFVKRLLAEGKGGEFVAPLVAAPDWAKQKENPSPEKLNWEVVQDAVDEVRGVRPEEAALYYQVLAKAASVKPAIIRQQAREVKANRRQKNPQWFRDGEYWMFKDIMENPDELRGKPITLRGYAREIRQYPAGENAAGLESLHEIWLFTEKSQSNPAVIVATDVPENLPIGNELIVPLRVTGYFFKLYGYHAGPKGRIAPMLLAGPVEILPEPESVGIPWWMIGLVAAGAIVVLVLVLFSFRGDRRRPKRTTGEPPPDLSALE